MNKLSLGFSPCPNDTFIFYALVHKKIKGKLEFSEYLNDVETLNKKAIQKKLDVTKASFFGFGNFREDYCLLKSGCALGRGCGPLIVAKNEIPLSELSEKKIAIPGKMTTAHLLLKLFLPDALNVIEMPFDSIMNAVSIGIVDAGVIIHEGRFTYPLYNLIELIDLGKWWEEETSYTIPLGGIFAKRSLGVSLINEIDRMIYESVKFSFKNKAFAWEYIKSHAQELDDEVINQHIKLYVNDYTLNIGDGIKAVDELLKRAEKLNLILSSDKPIFI